MVDALDNIKPICEVERVGSTGTIYDVPRIVARDRQQTLSIRWTLEAAFKRRISYMISSEQCSFDEILDAYQKRGIARTLFLIVCGIRQYLGHLTKEHRVGFEAAAWRRTHLVIDAMFVTQKMPAPDDSKGMKARNRTKRDS
ncbi:hypothetical protein AgCh_017604 [Apium graveolens]